VAFYNHHRYQESLENLTPADVYFGKVNEVKNRREWIKEKTYQMRQVESFQKPYG
jgi:hypothetical protein